MAPRLSSAPMVDVHTTRQIRTRSRTVCTVICAPRLRRPGGVFLLTVSVTFTATWTGTNGAGGVLPALTVTAAVPVQVDELQALNQ